MEKHKKNILLISYTFPPYPGIGGRRWAKFAKYLSREGFTLHVLHANNPFRETSLWSGDVDDNMDIVRYSLKEHYPKILTLEPKTLFEKIKYRLALMVVKLMSKGTMYDTGIFWKKSLLFKSRELIRKHSIKNVIISGAPFSSIYYFLELKKIFKDLNLLADFRDPWTWGKGYGMGHISAKRKNFEKKMEERVVNESDLISVPSEEMLLFLKNFYKDAKNKFFLLPHGYDEDEIKVNKKIKSDKMRIILYGTLYDKQDKVFEALANYIRSNEPNITLDIYSNSKRYSNYFLKEGGIRSFVQYYNSLTPNKLFEKFESYDFVLIVQPDFAKDFITTKVYEIIQTRTPIILISKQGLLSDFIKKNRLGAHIDTQDLNIELNDLIKLKTNFDYDSSFSVEEYSFKLLTKNLVKNFIR